jgi:hypothetical protein
MNDEPRDPSVQPPESDSVESGVSPSVTQDGASPANTLTPEEQMALFEQELKETDWGHQPC